MPASSPPSVSAAASFPVDPCETIEPLLSAYVDDEASEIEAELIEAHVTGCKHCASALAFQRLAHQALSRPARVAMPAGLSERIALATYARPTFAQRVGALLRPTPARVAVGALAVAGVAVVMVLRPGSDSQPSFPTPPQVAAEQSTPSTGRIGDPAVLPARPAPPSREINRANLPARGADASPQPGDPARASTTPAAGSQTASRVIEGDGASGTTRPVTGQQTAVASGEQQKPSAPALSVAGRSGGGSVGNSVAATRRTVATTASGGAQQADKTVPPLPAARSVASAQQQPRLPKKNNGSVDVTPSMAPTRSVQTARASEAPPVSPSAESVSTPADPAPPAPATSVAMVSKPVEGMKSGDDGRLVLPRRAVSVRLPDPVELPSEGRRSAAAAHSTAVEELGQGGGGRYTLLSDQAAGSR